MSNILNMSPAFKPLNAGTVLQKTGHALPSRKKSIITLNLTLYNVCSVHRGMFSTSGGFSTLEGIMSTSGGYHEYIGGIS